MKKIPEQYKQYVEEKSPHFVQAVARAKQSLPFDKANQTRNEQEKTAVQTTLGAFRGNLMLLYASLWYAASEGVNILFTPTGRKSRRPPKNT